MFNGFYLLTWFNHFSYITLISFRLGLRKFLSKVKVRGKGILALNEVPRHEDTIG
jgi:hypothetical protein